VGLGDPRTDLARLSALPNVHLPGPRPYDGLPAVLRGADVALIPYVRTPLTDSVFPMKVFEYLAAGLPVVATALESLAEVEDVVHCASTDEFLAAIERTLSDPGDAEARSARARPHSWDARANAIETMLAELEGVA
jgi:glycosyltransferase involved in cell wall biosynthesis